MKTNNWQFKQMVLRDCISARARVQRRLRGDVRRAAAACAVRLEARERNARRRAVAQQTRAALGIRAPEAPVVATAKLTLTRNTIEL